MKKLLLLPLLRYPTLIGLEQKLTKLAREGKNLDQMGMQSSLFLTLFPTPSRDFCFAVDYSKDPQPSLRIEWESHGWQLCAKTGNYYVWRSERKNGQEPSKPERALLAARRAKLAVSFRMCMFIFLIAAAALLAGIVLLAMNDLGEKTPERLLELIGTVLIAGYFFWSSGLLRRSAKENYES